MTPSLMALLCEDPRTQEAPREEGSAQDSGQISHRASLAGLSVGLRTPVQAGEYVPRGLRLLSSLGTRDQPPSRLEKRTDMSDR